MGPITVLTVNEFAKALPFKQRFEDAGIRARIKDDHELQKMWYMTHPFASIHVQVPERDYERALHLLKEWHEHEGILQDAIHCPECGSPRVQYPQFTRKIVASWFPAFLCTLGILERKFFCEDCQYTWPVTVKAERPMDLLGWPKKQARPSQH